MIEIRPAAVTDAQRLAELRWEFRSGKSEPVEDRDTFIARCAGWMRAQLTTNLQWHAWAAVDGGRIVGQVWAHPMDKVPNPAHERERHVYISNLYVLPGARGGVGSRLMDAVIAWATAPTNVDRVILWPTERSRSLYARHGFRAASDVVELKLDG